MVKPAIYRFDLFKQFPEIIQGISTRSFGNIRKFKDTDSYINLCDDNLKLFLKELNVSYKNTVGMKQNHTNTVKIISSADSPIVGITDGLVTKQKQLFLYAVSADCLPIVAYDPNAKITGVIHAGYKGLATGIVEEFLRTFYKLGSNPANIYVGIGAGIGVCCYNVTRERLKLFEKRFSGIYEEREGLVYLDLKAIVKQILAKEGIRREHIEVMDYCTKDTNNIFFSYRGDSKDTFGHFATLIGMK